MAKKMDLEILRELMDPDKMDLRCANILDLEVSNDRSQLYVSVNLLPEGIEMVARMSWELVGPDAGMFQFPSKNDLVLIDFCNGNEDEAFVVKRLTTKQHKIPIQAVNGHLVVRAKAGTKAFLNSDTEINITRGDPGNEQLLLGNTFKTAYSTHLTTDAEHTHIGNLGYFTAPPDPGSVSSYNAIKASPVDDSLMLSDIAKTEK